MMPLLLRHAHAAAAADADVTLCFRHLRFRDDTIFRLRHTLF